jgi:hypothetical protein
MMRSLLVRSRLILRRKVPGALIAVTLVLTMQVGMAPLPRARLGLASESDGATGAGSPRALTLRPDSWWYPLPYLPLSTVNWD